jgi:hypothetical protein
MSQKRVKELCEGDCKGPVLERNRYFTGKYMTERDFAGEQEYFLNHRRLHNRLLHGWGIVCGLRVMEHPNAECRENWLVVKAGVAIDCCGREIFLADDLPLEVPVDELPAPPVSTSEEEQEKDVAAQDAWQHTEETKRSGYRDKRVPGGRRGHGGSEEDSGWDEDAPPEPWPQQGLLVCLCYREEAIEPVPVLYSEGSCDPAHQESNRVRELAHLEFRRLDEMQQDCWRLPGGSWVDPCRDDCNEPLPGPSGACLTPACPCGGCVPLALLTAVPEDEPGSARFTIDLRGRRQLPPPAHYLTHVVGINWPHGGELTLRQLRNRLGGELRIRFDRKILPAEGMATGINSRTFFVQFGGITRHLEILPSPECEEPRIDEDGCTAIYPIAAEYLRGRENISDSFIYISLKCDFLVDCHEMPVDGNHLGGRLPSGNGVPGGEFVSWFRVAPGHGYEEEDR